MVVFGSGGHTTEMLLMLKNLNFLKYGSVTFVIGHSDTFSEGKIRDFYQKNRNLDLEQDIKNLTFVRLFRSREVKQSYFSSVFSTVMGLLHSLRLILLSNPDLVSHPIISSSIFTNHSNSLSQTGLVQQCLFAMLTSSYPKYS